MISVNVLDRRGERATFSVQEGQRLLHAGLASGIGLPHECATGTCGNCKASVVRGDVGHLWPGAPGARVCRKPGDVLLCQTTANSTLDLVLASAFSVPCAPPTCNRRGRIVERRILTPDIGLFEVAVDEPMPYRPGQFALLSGFGIDGPRAYSMTHCEPNRPHLQFLVRRNASGSFTNALFDCALNSDEIEVFGPVGRATFDCAEERPFVAVAGGSGIAGMMSIIRHALSNDHFRRHPSRLFFGLRDADSSYLLDELSAFVHRSEARLAITVAFSDAPCSAEFAAMYPTLDFRHGLVHEVMRERLCSSDHSEFMTTKRLLFFVGGPPLMVNATMRTLISNCKISPTEIRYDRFG